MNAPQPSPRPRRLLRSLLWKDAARELRSKETLQAGLVLVGLFFVLDLFAFVDLRGDPTVAAVALWTPLLFATAALAGRGFATEADRGTLEWLRTAPVPLAAHGWSRTVVTLAVSLLLGAGTLGLMSAAFRVPAPATVWLVLLLAAVGLSVVGTLAGALAAQARAREVLLPILLVPVAAPLLQAGVRASLEAFEGGSAGVGAGGSNVALLLMVGYDLVAVGVAWLLWPFALESD